jgi:hypothetical protein
VPQDGFSLVARAKTPPPADTHNPSFGVIVTLVTGCYNPYSAGVVYTGKG